MLFNENTYEQAIIELFEGMGYTHIYAPDMERDYTYEYQTIRKMSIIMPDLVKCHEALKSYIYGEPYNP